MKKSFVILFGCIAMAACNNQDSNNNNSGEDSAGRQDTSMHGGHTASGDMNAEIVTELNEMDRDFIMKAGMGNTAEVEAGKLARQKSSNAAIKDFGAQMVRDHTDAQEKLKRAAGAAAAVPDSTDKKHADMKKKLQGLSGTQFDKEYISGQLADHRETVALFEQQANGGGNTLLKDFARTMLPHLRGHLQKAEELSGQVNAKQ